MDTHVMENLVVLLKELGEEYPIVFGTDLTNVIYVIQKFIVERKREPKGSQIITDLLDYVEANTIFDGECYKMSIKKFEDLQDFRKWRKEVEECPHGTFGGKEHCMACRPELKLKEGN